MKIYTKTGDAGMTGLLGSHRVRKDDHRIDAYGTVDELNAVLGLARSLNLDSRSDALLGTIQDELFAVGSALADPDPEGQFQGAITAEHVARLEHAIDAMESELAPLDRFILPGGTTGAAQVHLARTVCRRAERLVVGLCHQPDEHVHPLIVVYLNRLSDALFVLARLVNHRAGVADIPWRGL